MKSTFFIVSFTALFVASVCAIVGGCLLMAEAVSGSDKVSQFCDSSIEKIKKPIFLSALVGTLALACYYAS